MVHHSNSGSMASADFEAGTIPVQCSGWLSASGELPGHAALTQDIDTDVVVVGAGVVGASLALHLAERGIACVVLEARQPGWGASGRNAGHVAPCLEEMDNLRAWPDQGARLLDCFIEQRDIVFDICRRYGIDADAEKVGYLEASRRDWSRGVFERKAVEWRARGFQLDAVAGAELRALTGTDEYRQGLYWREGGRVNPYRFTNGMITAARGLGCRIFGESPMLACTRAGERWRVRTPSGSVLAQRVVLCTNGHAQNAAFPELSATNYPLVACGLATRPLPETLLRDINPSRATLMQYPTGLYPLVIDGHNRLVTSQIPRPGLAADAAVHFARFLRFLHRAWPRTREVDIALESYWTGMTFSSASHYPQLYQIDSGAMALINTGTWGNVIGPLLGRNLAHALAADRMEQCLLPLERPVRVSSPRSFEIKIRRLLIPLAQCADRLGLA